MQCKEDVSGRLASLLFERVCRGLEGEDEGAAPLVVVPAPAKEEQVEEKKKKGPLSFLAKKKEKATSSTSVGEKEEGQTGSNVLVSPFSVGTALSLALLGSRGTTAAQLRGLLSSATFSPSEDEHAATLDVARQWGALSDAVRKMKGVEWAASNGVWVGDDCPVAPEFAAQAGEAHGANIAGDLPFSSNPEQARATINDAVSNQTHGHITDLLPPRSITSNTRMVLTNAIHFKGQWEKAFGKHLTQKEDFHLLGGSAQKTVEMMHHPSLKMRHRSFERHAVIELPYRAATSACSSSCPTPTPQPTSSSELAKAHADMRLEPVNLKLPRFRVHYEIEMSQVIQDIGAPTPFDSDLADFTGLTSTCEHLVVSAVYHQTYMNVDEVGTEAAAATAVVMGPGGGRPPLQPVRYVVNRPFVCVLYHPRQQCVLFVGRICDPSA